ncbi:MAG: bifunctional aspartate kinase/homoserine dehydrogenase I, partial [Brumimicrobium sp.]|nr:bifunctional aspartate kinase/homoserine dehydrogenase I [Brumimicrobium sp.]
AASPKFVPEAQRIERLSFREAHELANFGASILHPKTITPLIRKNIPLKIYNSLNPKGTGTIIDEQGSRKGIKAVSVIEDLALITIEGKELSGKIGIDARIFRVLSELEISIRLISQASSERGIGFIIDQEVADQAVNALKSEFQKELYDHTISEIKSNSEMAVIAIVGRHNYSLEKAIQGLRRNKIWMYLISNSISGDHISLVIDNKNLKKAVNVVHGQVFGVTKTINLFALGKGTVGGKLIDQIVNTSEEVSARRGLRIKVVGVADSKGFVFDERGLGDSWRNELQRTEKRNDIEKIIATLRDSALENIVIADNTSSQEITDHYLNFLKAGFDLVASNKKSNSGPYANYQEIRELLKRKDKHFFYETNVGAGLPIIDTIKHLYNSADRITRIRGVFSGSLSYIFNNYSERSEDFSAILLEAKEKGYTEPDPREDLNGLDVARKLIILAREIGLEVELSDIQLQDLIPQELSNEGSFEDFIAKKDVLNEYFDKIKSDLKPDEVLRYIGELDAVNQILKVSLVKTGKDTPLGGIRNADAIFEIYTEEYGDQPIVIQGAGAGGEVTARGVYSDLIRIGGKF